MKILTATIWGSGIDDFSWTNEGELVQLAGNQPAEGVLIGLDTRKGTTTAHVVEQDIDKKTWLMHACASMANAYRLPQRQLYRMAEADYEWMKDSIKHLPIGTVVTPSHYGLVIRNQADLSLLFK